MARSCKKCASRKDCWIRNVIECNKTWGDPIPSTYELVFKASCGECPLYIDKDESTEEY